MPGNPTPGSPRASVQSRWWVLGGKFTPVKVVQSSTEPQFAIAGPFVSSKAAQDWIQNNSINYNPLHYVQDWGQSWLKSMGADIGSGIESGFVTILQDIWNVIVGPIEVLGGLAIVLVTFIAYFKDDIAAAATMAMAFA
jgi:hypothetical protein